MAAGLEDMVLQVIFVDSRLSRAHTFQLTRARLFFLALGSLTLIITLSALISAAVLRLATRYDVPAAQQFLSMAVHDQTQRNDQYVQNNVLAMARMLGDIQARMLRLDALGERISKLAGIHPQEFNFKEVPGRGGALSADARPLSMAELQSQVAQVDRSVDERADYMNVVESQLVSSEARDALLPRGTPVSKGFVGSGFGYRTDPITGERSMHTGVDFAAPIGTTIYAAAGGVVMAAERNPDFGNMVEIDHGHGLSTMYAHTSRMLVRPGDLVRKGQKIAEVGTTGRSTGPHLHFEVHVNGKPQNPARYLATLRPGSAGTLAAGTTAPETR
jgi:murein DD-endopeptidase MepM/ murein hydrolase activator NlpD